MKLVYPVAAIAVLILIAAACRHDSRFIDNATFAGETPVRLGVTDGSDIAGCAQRVESGFFLAPA